VLPPDRPDALRWVQRVRALADAVRRAGAAELTVHPRALVAHGVSCMFPQLTFSRTRTALLRASGLRIGARSRIMGELRITGHGVMDLLSIGSDTLITGPLHIDLGATVRIGDGVQMGHHVTLLTIDHEMGPPEHRCGGRVVAPIVVEDGAWLASHVLVLPGVTIGRGSVVGAGAVVVHDVPRDTLVAGTPARFVRDLNEVAPTSVRRQSTRPMA